MLLHPRHLSGRNQLLDDVGPSAVRQYHEHTIEERGHRRTFVVCRRARKQTTVQDRSDPDTSGGEISTPDDPSPNCFM